MLCLLLLQVVGEGFGVVLWRLQFQLTRLVCGNSFLSRCGGSCFWMLGRVAYCATLLRWRPGTVRGVRLPQHPCAVAGGKKPFFAIGFPFGGLG